MLIVIAQLNPIVGDLPGNLNKILGALKWAQDQRADLVLFSEMAICGYSPRDLLFYPDFIQAIEESLSAVIEASKKIIVIIGSIRRNLSASGHKLFNTAAIIQNQKLLGYQDKMLLPNYDVFDETRYFEPGSGNRTWELFGRRILVTICEDLWCEEHQENLFCYHKNPLSNEDYPQPDLILNLAASPFNKNKSKTRFNVYGKAAKLLSCPLASCNQVGGNDEIIYDGHSVYINAQGVVIHAAKRFEEELMLIDTESAGLEQKEKNSEEESIYHALVMGVRDYFSKLGFTKACLGLSGGIDSALVACIATKALGAHNVLAVSMPSKYSSEGSIVDAHVLAKRLGIECKKIEIESVFKSYTDLLAAEFQDDLPDITEENLQARIRGMILMALSNKWGHIVLSCGNKSESAVGYATLYGDMCGGLSVIGDLLKRDVYALARWLNTHEELIPQAIIEKPPSAELRPNQKDSDTLPDYEIVDTVVQAYLEGYCSSEEIVCKHGYQKSLVVGLIRKIEQNEYKRRQSAPSLRISLKAFGVGRRFPIVQKKGGGNTAPER